MEVEKLMGIELNTKPNDGDDEKYIETKIKNIWKQYNYRFL